MCPVFSLIRLFGKVTVENLLDCHICLKDSPFLSLNFLQFSDPDFITIIPFYATYLRFFMSCVIFTRDSMEWG